MGKAIIFGASGQDGHYMEFLLRKEGVEVISVSRSGDYNKTNLIEFDEVKSLVSQVRPDYIFHFAANSTTRHDTLFENHKTICVGTINILEAVRLCASNARVFISGSGLMFQNNSFPIKETDPFDPKDAYSMSRIHSFFSARYYRSTFGIKVYFGFFYNHDSPLRSSRHVSRMVIDGVKNIKKGIQETIEIGDIHTVKEWTFAGDVVKAVWLLINQDVYFESNLGSGLGYSIEKWLEICFDKIGKDWRLHVKIKKGFSSEYKVLVSDPNRIFSLGWKPEVSIYELAEMMLK